MSCLAVIPARVGSKRIPRKNIKDFLGKPIIAYSIETALKSQLFDEVMVSTDDNKIAEIAKKYGAKVPFMRSSKTADDHSGLVDVLLEVIRNYCEKGIEFSDICCILPTAALLTVENLKNGWEIYSENNYEAVLAVQRFNYPIQRALEFNDQKLKMIWPENYRKRSQDLEESYHDAGQFYFIKAPVLIKEKSLFTKNSGAVVLNGFEAQDIDNLEDWKLAELKHKALNE